MWRLYKQLMREMQDRKGGGLLIMYKELKRKIRPS